MQEPTYHEDSRSRYDDFHQLVMAAAAAGDYLNHLAAYQPPAVLTQLSFERWTTLPVWLQEDSIRVLEGGSFDADGIDWTSHAVRDRWVEHIERITRTVAWIERQLWAINKRLEWRAPRARELRIEDPPLYTRFQYNDLQQPFPLLPLSGIYTHECFNLALDGLLRVCRLRRMPITWAPSLSKNRTKYGNKWLDMADPPKRHISCNIWDEFASVLFDGDIPVMQDVFVHRAHVPFWGGVRPGSHESGARHGYRYDLVVFPPIPSIRALFDPNTTFNAALQVVQTLRATRQDDTMTRLDASWASAMFSALQEQWPGGLRSMRPEAARELLLELQAIYDGMDDRPAALPFPTLVLECITRNPLADAAESYKSRLDLQQQLPLHSNRLSAFQAPQPRPIAQAHLPPFPHPASSAFLPPAAVPVPSVTQHHPMAVPPHPQYTFPTAGPPHPQYTYPTAGPPHPQYTYPTAGPSVSVPSTWAPQSAPPLHPGHQDPRLFRNPTGARPQGPYPSLARIKQRLGRGRAERDRAGLAWES